MSQVRRLLHRLGGRDPSDDADLPDAAPMVDLRPHARGWQVELPLARGTATRDAVPHVVLALGTVPMPGPDLPPDADEAYEELLVQAADDAVTPVDRAPPEFLFAPAPAPAPVPVIAAATPEPEAEDWDSVIARARLAAGSIPPPIATAAEPAPAEPADDEEWEWAMALARARLAEPAPPPASAPRRHSASDSGRSSSSMKA